MKTNTAPVYVGVDVAKATLQVHLRGAQIERHNTPADLAKLCKKLQALPGAHVICEATRDSGTMKGKRCIGGGRPKVRVALYMSSLSAIRCNPILRAFYQRLIAKGKPAKVGLTAVMRKLLVYMNHQLKALAAKPNAAAQSKS